MAIALNQLPTKPELKDLLDLHRKLIFLGLNCHHVGTIQSFSPSTQTAKITINYTRSYFQGQATGAQTQVQKSFPVMLDVPCICLGGGTSSLRFPIAKGDECLVLFNDRDMDNWFNGSSNSAVNTGRLHSFSDGIALVGLRSLANVLQSYSATAVELKNGPNGLSIGQEGDDTVITVADGGLTVTFRAAGGVVIQNPTGNFTFENNADVSFNTGTVQGLFGNHGKVSFTNSMGELITAISFLIDQLSTATPTPVVTDPIDFALQLSVLESFVT